MTWVLSPLPMCWKGWADSHWTSPGTCGTHAWAHTYVHVCTLTHLHTSWLEAHMRAHLHACFHVCTHTCTYMHTRTHVQVHSAHTNTFIHMHTLMHTPKHTHNVILKVKYLQRRPLLWAIPRFIFYDKSSQWKSGWVFMTTYQWLSQDPAKTSKRCLSKEMG